MIFTAMRQVHLLAATTTSGTEPSNTVVVVTGLGLVFAILILLTLILSLQGKVFASLDEKKKNAGEAKVQQAAIPAAPVMVAPAAAPAPVVQEGIPPEVVAAITAAVAQIEGGKYTLKAVSATQKGRGQWGLAGVISYTEPF